MSNESPRKPKGSSQSSSRSPRPSRDAAGSRGPVQRSGGRSSGKAGGGGREDRSTGRSADARRGNSDAPASAGGRRTDRQDRSGSNRAEHGGSAGQRPQRSTSERPQRGASERPQRASSEHPQRGQRSENSNPRAGRSQYGEERSDGSRGGRSPRTERSRGDAQGERTGRGSAAAGRTPASGNRGAAGGRGTPEAAPAALKAKLSQAERFPASEFARREGMLEGLPAVMVVNRSLKGYPYRKEFPWCLRLVVAYGADPETGQPLPKEERVLEAFEQNLFGLLKKSVNGHYVGHTSWGGSREFVFYLDDGGEAEEPLEGFAQAQKRELELSLDEDVRWENIAHYFDYRD